MVRRTALVLLTLISLTPVLFVVGRGIGELDREWLGHLWSSLLPLYLGDSVIVGLGASLLAFLLGVLPAWLTHGYEFRGRGWATFATLLPLTMPAFVTASVYVEASAAPFWGSRWALMIELAAEAAPFVFLLTRVGLGAIPSGLIDTAAMLGAGLRRRLFAVWLPLLAPALLAAACLALASALGDFGAANHLGIPTLGVGLQQQWFALNRPDAALVLSLVLVLLAIGLAVPVVAWGLRREARATAVARRAHTRRRLTLGTTIAVHALCMALVVPGFWAPAAYVAWWTGARLGRTALATLFGDVGGTLLMAGATTGICLGITAAFVLLSDVGRRPRGTGWLLWLLAGNYLMSPLVWSTLWLSLGVTGRPVIAISAALRFLPLLALPAIDAMGRLPSAWVETSRTLGAGRLSTTWRVTLPSILPAVTAGTLLVFVLSANELTLNTVLQPFAHQTLALRIFAGAKENLIRQAAPWITSLALVSLYPVWAFSRLLEQARGIDA